MVWDHMQRSSRSKPYHHEKTSGLFWHFVFKELSKLTLILLVKNKLKKGLNILEVIILITSLFHLTSLLLTTSKNRNSLPLNVLLFWKTEQHFLLMNAETEPNTSVSSFLQAPEVLIKCPSRLQRCKDTKLLIPLMASFYTYFLIHSPANPSPWQLCRHCCYSNRSAASAAFAVTHPDSVATCPPTTTLFHPTLPWCL